MPIGDVLWAPRGQRPCRGSELQMPRSLKSRWPLFSPVCLRPDCTGAGKRAAGLGVRPCGSKPALTHAVFVCPEMLSHVCNAFPVVLHTRHHLSSPQHPEKMCLSVHLDFVLLLSTMTSSYYYNTGCAGNSKKTWLCWLSGNLGSAPPKPMLSRCQREVRNSSLPSSEWGQKGHSGYFSASRKPSLGEEPRGWRHLPGRDPNSPSPGEAERWSGKPEAGLEN